MMRCGLTRPVTRPIAGSRSMTPTVIFSTPSPRRLCYRRAATTRSWRQGNRHYGGQGSKLHSFGEFLQALELLDWSPAGHIDPQVTDLLAEVGREPRLVRDLVRSWDSLGLEERQLRCHETSTHYK